MAIKRENIAKAMGDLIEEGSMDASVLLISSEGPIKDHGMIYMMATTGLEEAFEMALSATAQLRDMLNTEKLKMEAELNRKNDETHH